MNEIVAHDIHKWHLQRHTRKVLIFILALIVIIPIWSSSSETVIKIKQGVLDLTAADLSSAEVYVLQGEWTFYQQAILKPQENFSGTVEKIYQELPAYGHPLEDIAKAYGTYKLQIELPETIPETLMLWLPFEGGVYRFYVNEALMAVNNQTDPYQNAQDLRHLPITIQSDKKTITFILNVSWLSNRHAGLTGPVLLGSKGAIYQYLSFNSQKVFWSIGLLGITLCMLLLLGYILENEIITSFVLFAISLTLQVFFYQMQSATLPKRLSSMNSIRFAIFLAGIIVYLYALYVNKHEEKFINNKWIKVIKVFAALFALSATYVAAEHLIELYRFSLLYGSLVPLGLLCYLLYLKFRLKCDVSDMLVGMTAVYALTQIYQCNKLILALDCINLPVGFLCVAVFHVVYLTIVARQKLQHTNDLLEENRSMNLQLKESNQILEETVENRTEALKLANQNLTEAENLRKELISTISHELNTPLTLIRGYAEAMQDGLISLDQSKSYVNLIHSKALDMTALLDDLIKLNRLNPEGIVLKQERSSLALLMADMSNKYGQDICNNGLNFELAQPASNWVAYEVYIDYRRVNQVFANIIFNAIKYTPNGGKITMGCQIDGDMVVISIKDTGPGIPESEHAYIFERYYQCSIDCIRDSAGQGLGLSIAKEIVNLHGGKIWVESVLEKGSTFFFTLPVYLS